MLRRSIVVVPGALALRAVAPGLVAAAPAVFAQSRPAPLRFGADRSLAASGLARSLQAGFAADTGIDIKLVALPATALLDAVRDGEVDVALANAPAAEAALEKQTLVHDRRAIARGDFLLVGPRAGAPVGPARNPPAMPRGAAPAAPRGAPALPRDPLAAMVAIAELGRAGSAVFLSAGDGSGAHLCEQALWRAAGVEPKAPWHEVAATGKGGFAGRARARPAFALVDRGEWLAEGGAPLAIVAEGGPALAETVHAMRSFRASHPAGRIFLTWIGGGHGRAVVARQRGYRAAA